jgi:hypothetical protein
MGSKKALKVSDYNFWSNLIDERPVKILAVKAVI